MVSIAKVGNSMLLFLFQYSIDKTFGFKAKTVKAWMRFAVK